MCSTGAMTAARGDTTVRTAAGAVAGRTLDGCTVHMGIPYAAPPEGPRRWAPPVPPEPWDGVRDAGAPGPAAWQPVGGPLDGLVPDLSVAEQGEDCLTLNVWSPDLAGSAPVLVWIHGGAFSIGSGSLAVYDGARLAAATGTVVVSINYRLGAFGFLVLDDDSTAPNVGLLDQVAALEWVRDSIAAFGGDPDRVTVFGESAGAGSVLSLLSMPAARGLFRGAIVQSGATDLLLDRPRAAIVAETLARCAGLDTVDVDALRALPASVILEAQAAAAGALFATVGMMPFHPCVDGDVLPVAWLEAARRGTNPVPVVIGTTRDEMDLFAMFDPGAATLDEDGLRQRLHHAGADADRAIEAYASTGTTEPPAVWRRISTDTSMWMPAIRIAEARAAHGPTWMYRFDWEAADPTMGAPHAIDIPFPFTTIDVGGWSTFVEDAPAAAVLASTVQRAWAAFAHTGEPVLAGVDWPRYEPSRRATAVLGRSVTITDDPNGPVRRVWS